VKRLISLALLLCLLAGIFPAAAENAETVSGTGYDFDFTARLNPEAFSKKLRNSAQGYADLLEALRFQGSIVWDDSRENFKVSLSIIPVAAASGTLDLQIQGAEDLMFVSSSLLKDKIVKLSNYSLLGFCSKMSEHLDIPLHYLALLVPYTWTYCLGLPIQDWESMLEEMDETGLIPEKAIQYLWECWDYRLVFDTPLNVLIDALCKDSEMEDSFRGMVAEIPDYFVKQVAQEKEIQIRQNEEETVWNAATGTIYRETRQDRTETKELLLPRMKTGYLPVFSLETYRENSWHSDRLDIRLSGEEEEDRADLVNLQASLISFPDTWPADCYSLLSLSLTGGLLPNVGFAAYFSGEKNGHARIEFRKPTVDLEPGAVMLALEGSILPFSGDIRLEDYSHIEEERLLDLFIANDARIRDFLPDLVEPLLKGMFRFLSGIPTSACQTIMDDLTEIGVFEVLLTK